MKNLASLAILIYLLLMVSTVINAQFIELGGANNSVFNIEISSITTDFSGNVYASGYLKNTNGKYYVAKWNGSSWGELGGTNTSIFNSNIHSITTDGSGNIYAAGAFTNTNGSEYVAKWNGSNWSELGGSNTSTFNSNIRVITTDVSGNLYVGGYFTNSNGNEYVAKWNGSSWIELGGTNTSTFNNAIESIVTDGSSNVYAAGEFFDANSNYYVSKWDGKKWDELGGKDKSTFIGTPGGILSITTDGSGNVYAAGGLTNKSGNFYVAVWNGSSWGEHGGINTSTFNNSINSIAFDGSGNLFAAGAFTNSNGKRYVAKWNGNSWSELGGSNTSTFNNQIFSITTNGIGNLYAGGAFTNSKGKLYVAGYAGAFTPIYTWNGKNSLDWNIAKNWSTSSIPTSTSNVIIPATTNQPIITRNVTAIANNLVIQGGATLTNNGILNVYGKFSDSGSFVSGSSSSVLLSGSDTIIGTDTFANLEIQGNYSVGGNAGDKIYVTEKLIKTSGTLTTNNKLMLVSNANGTALIQENGGTLSGKAYVQHYAGGNFGYHHFSSPVSGATVNSWSNAFPIFGPDGAPSWLSNWGSLQYYDEPANTTSLLDSGYYNYTALSNSLVSGQGYTAWLNSLPTLNTFGTPNNGAISLPVTHTAGTNDPKGWNMVGNPYPSPISWTALKAKNPGLFGDASCYLWKASGTGTDGTWTAYDGTVGVNGAGDVINSSLGFFVYVNNSGTLNFDNSVRVYDYTSPEIFGTKSNATNTLRLSIKDAVANTNDEAVAYTGYQTGFSRKMVQPAGATNATIAFDVKGTKAAINVLTAIDSKTELPITLLTPNAGTYTLSLSTKNINLPVYLKDGVTGTYTDLSAATTITTTAKETIGRYSLVFKQSTVDRLPFTVYPNPSKNNIVLNGNHIASVQVVDNLGRVVKTVSLKDAINPTLTLSGLSAGAYHLKVQTTDGKVSNVAVVKE